MPVGGDQAGLLPVNPPVPADVLDAATAYLADTEHTGAAGVVQALPRPGAVPRRLLLVGVGAGDEAGWRAASTPPAVRLMAQSCVTPIRQANGGHSSNVGLGNGVSTPA